MHEFLILCTLRGCVCLSAIWPENDCFRSLPCFIIILSVSLCPHSHLRMPVKLHHCLFCASTRLLWLVFGAQWGAIVWSNPVWVRSVLEFHSGCLFTPHCGIIITKPFTSVSVLMCQDLSEGFEKIRFIALGCCSFFLSFDIHLFSRCFFSALWVTFPNRSHRISWCFFESRPCFSCRVPSGFNLTNLSRHILLC